jgi:hypothetical protein
LLENVVVERVDQVRLVPRSITGLGIDKKISSILEIDNEMLFTSSLGPPKQIVDLVLHGHIVIEKVKATYLVHIVGVNTVTSLFGSSLDPLLHDLLDVLFALLAMDVDIPFVPISKFVLKSLGTGTHAVFVDRYPFSTVTIRIESKFVAPDRHQLLTENSKGRLTWKAPRYRQRYSRPPSSPSYGNPHLVISG